MQAATCATSFIPGTRSSRAISEACSEAGTAAAARPAPPRAPPWSAPRRTAARRRSGPTISSTTLGGSARVAGQPAARSPRRRAAAEPVERQPRDVGVAAPRAAANSGRLVRAASTRSAAMRSTAESSSSSVVGIDPVGVLEHHQHRAAPRRGLSSWSTSAANSPVALALRAEVRRLRGVALGSDQQRRASATPPSPSSRARRAAAPRACRACARPCRRGAKPAARSSC